MLTKIVDAVDSLDGDNDDELLESLVGHKLFGSGSWQIFVADDALNNDDVLDEMKLD